MDSETQARQGPGREGVSAEPPWSGGHTHQRGHGESNDLEVAIVVPLGLKVMVLPGVAPRHGAGTVPGVGTGQWFLHLQDRASRTHLESTLLTWGCSGKRCTGASAPESWGSSQSRRTGAPMECCWGTQGGVLGEPFPTPPPGPPPLTTTRMCLARSLEPPVRKSEKAVCGVREV